MVVGSWLRLPLGRHSTKRSGSRRGFLRQRAGEESLEGQSWWVGGGGGGVEVGCGRW